MLKKIWFILFSLLINVSHATPLVEVALIDDFNGANLIVGGAISATDPTIYPQDFVTVDYAPAFGGKRTVIANNDSFSGTRITIGGGLLLWGNPAGVFVGEQEMRIEWSTDSSNGIDLDLGFTNNQFSGLGLHQSLLNRVNIFLEVSDIFGNLNRIQFEERYIDGNPTSNTFDNILFSDMLNIDFSRVKNISLIAEGGYRNIRLENLNVLADIPLPSSFFLLILGFVFLRHAIRNPFEMLLDEEDVCTPPSSVR